MAAEDDGGDEIGGPDELETIATSRWFVLAETADGYGIWRRDDDRTGPPIAEFGEDEEGFASADREFRRRNREPLLFSVLPTVLAWFVAVGVCVWVLASLYVTLWTLSVIPSLNEQLGGPPTLISAMSTIAYDVWLGSLAVMIMLWLLRRAREDPLA